MKSLKIRIIHVLSDGKEVDTIEGVKVPINDSTVFAYKAIFDKERSYQNDN